MPTDPKKAVMSRFSILTRLSMLSAGLLLILIASTIYLDSRLSRNAQVLSDEARLVHLIKSANAASKAFGDYKHWITDLAVSLLVLSEEEAEKARIRFIDALQVLEQQDPRTVAVIRSEMDVLTEQANRAIEAYTDDQRVIGNSLMAQARNHIRVIDQNLEKVVNALDAEAQRLSTAGLAEAESALSNSHLIIAVGTLVGLVLTFLVLQSIRVPLRRLVSAIGEIGAGRLDADIPPAGPDEIGAMAGTLSLFRDSLIERDRLAQERERAQEEVRRAQTRLVEAIGTITEGFVLYDRDDRLVLYNDQYRGFYTGIPVEVGPGMLYADLIRALANHGAVKEAEGRIEEWVAERLERRAHPREAYEQRVGDRWLKISERPTAEGGIVGVFTDITELKGREAQLGQMVDRLAEARDAALRATETKSQFLANMSHELRTPLNAIIGISEMLLEEGGDDGQDDLLEPLGRIVNAGRHLLNLINDILDLSKIEAGKMELHLEQFELDEVIDDAVTMVATQAGKNRNRVAAHCPDEMPPMFADITRVRQIIFNLLSNACKFTEDGQIDIAATPIEHDGAPHVRITVKDTGIGMSEEQLDRLFKDFSQADSSTTRKYGGTGLGLAISARFCEMMGGTIGVSSIPGEGSTFTVTLPQRAPESVQARLAAVDEDTAPLRTSRESVPDLAENLVLIVDDDRSSREILSTLFAGEGFEVVTAENGREGLRLAARTRPSLITLDVMMPELDGWGMLQELKRDPGLAGIPVLMVSILDEKNKGYSLGAWDYVTKPIDRERVSGLLAKYRSGGREGEVLIVEDQEEARSMLRRVLASEGWRVAEAIDGQEALDYLKRARPDLIMLDLVMPRMDGFELLAEMRKNAAWRRIPVIVVTAADLSEEDRQRLNGGVERVISKAAPSKAEFLAEIRELAASMTSRRRVASGA